MQERGNPLLKKIDRYLGIPLVFCLSLFYKKKKLPRRRGKELQKGGHFLFLKTGAVGDSILLSAIALEIKEKYSGAKITLLCTRTNYGVVSLLAGIDQVLLFNLNKIWYSLRELRKNQTFDFVIDFASWPRLNSLISFFAPADFRLGFQSHGQYRHYIYDKAVEHRGSIHELDNYRNLLHATGLETKGFLPQIRTTMLKKKFGGEKIPEKSKRKQKTNSRTSSSRYQYSFSQPREKMQTIVSQYKKPIIFHPFPGGFKKEFKMWPMKNWEFLGTQLLLKGHSIWITGGNGEQEEAQKLADKIVLAFVKNSLRKLQGKTIKDKKSSSTLKNKNRVLSLAGQLTWEETAWLLLRAKTLVSVNTGIMHLAAALDCKVIALNGPSATTRWGAIGKQILNFRSNYECSPCLNLGFEYSCTVGGCMTRIKAKDVAKAMGSI